MGFLDGKYGYNVGKYGFFGMGNMGITLVCLNNFEKTSPIAEVCGCSRTSLLFLWENNGNLPSGNLTVCY